MPRAVGPRYPFAPLEKYLRFRDREPGRAIRTEDGGYGGVPDEILFVLGVSKESIKQYRKRGVSYWQADTFAVKAGALPHEIWPEWADHEPLTETERHQRRLRLNRESDKRRKAEKTRKAA